MQNTTIPLEKCQQCNGRVAMVGISVNLVLVTMKLFIGLVSGSKSCLADGLHSLSNIVSAFAITLSQNVSRKQEDEDFPFGYGKIEFIAAGCISLIIIVIAGALTIITLKKIFVEPQNPPHFSALIAAVISIITNEMLFRHMRCVGTRFKSQTIIANAWANRADCFSSLAVIVGVVGAQFGFHHLDPICAIIVVFVIIKVSLDILINSVKALMDTSVNDTYGEEIIGVVEKMAEVKAVDGLRTRHIGQKIWAEITIRIDGSANMKEGQGIADTVRKHLMSQVSDLERVIVYFEPEQEGL